MDHLLARNVELKLSWQSLVLPFSLSERLRLGRWLNGHGLAFWRDHTWGFFGI
jgi:hypothetical protein